MNTRRKKVAENFERITRHSVRSGMAFCKSNEREKTRQPAWGYRVSLFANGWRKDEQTPIR